MAKSEQELSSVVLRGYGQLLLIYSFRASYF